MNLQSSHQHGFVPSSCPAVVVAIVGRRAGSGPRCRSGRSGSTMSRRSGQRATGRRAARMLMWITSFSGRRIAGSLTPCSSTLEAAVTKISSSLSGSRRRERLEGAPSAASEGASCIAPRPLSASPSMAVATSSGAMCSAGTSCDELPPSVGRPWAFVGGRGWPRWAPLRTMFHHCRTQSQFRISSGAGLL